MSFILSIFIWCLMVQWSLLTFLMLYQNSLQLLQRCTCPRKSLPYHGFLHSEHKTTLMQCRKIYDISWRYDAIRILRDHYIWKKFTRSLYMDKVCMYITPHWRFNWDIIKSVNNKDELVLIYFTIGLRQCGQLCTQTLTFIFDTVIAKHFDAYFNIG